MIKAMLLAAATICAVPNMPARAAPEPVRTVKIDLASFDLRTSAGRAALSARVARAVDEVCGKVSDPQESRKHEALRCRRDTIPDVRAQLASLTHPHGPKVTADQLSEGR